MKGTDSSRRWELSCAGVMQIEKALAGCTAGAVSTILTYPLETLRTRMSMSGAQNLPQTIARIVEGQGVAGFYRVSSPTLAPPTSQAFVQAHGFEL